MRKLAFAAVLIAAVSTSALASDAVVRPWQGAQAALDVTLSDVQSGGIRAIEKHVPALEDALKNAIPAGQTIKLDDGATYVLSDGSTSALGGLLSAIAAAKKSNSTGNVTAVAIADPYPVISLYLGSYYNKTGQPTEALRALNAGIAVSDIAGMGVGATDSELLSEKAIALVSLKRFDEGLATYNQGLALGGLADRDRARLYRGRGYALTELGKLDDAEKAYRDSLTCEPGSERAENELRYIAQLRAGGAAAPTTMATVVPANPNAASTGACAKN